jgi:putative tricarboxylic transport membrane protein
MMKLVRVAAAPVAGIVLTIVLLFQARGMDEITQPGQLGPSFWPRLILVCLALACVAKLIVDVRLVYAASDASRMARPPISWARLVAAVGLIVLYVTLSPVIGFALATAVFIASFMWLSGTRSIPMIAANVGVGTLLLLYLFVKFVYLPLPKGDGPFEAFTVALYRALHLF